MTKAPLPPIDLTPARMAKPIRLQLSSRTGIDDAEIDAGARTVRLALGAPSQLPPGLETVRPARLNLVIPSYLEDQLKDAAHAKRSTVTSLILDALARAGYEVRPEDLVPDKRRRR